MVDYTALRVTADDGATVQYPESTATVNLSTDRKSNLVVSAVYDADNTTLTERTITVEKVDHGDSLGDLSSAVEVLTHTHSNGPTYAAHIQ